MVISRDEPFFAGHFPGNPLVPGVVILEYVVEAVAQRCGTDRSPQQIQSIKFLGPLRPGEELTIELELTSGTAVRFKCRAGDRPIAVGAMTMRPETRRTRDG